MLHASDCHLHDAPAYKRSTMCSCEVGRAIAHAQDAAMLTQSLIETGPASEDMTAATIALTQAREALSRAMIQANSGH